MLLLLSVFQSIYNIQLIIIIFLFLSLLLLGNKFLQNKRLRSIIKIQKVFRGLRGRKRFKYFWKIKQQQQSAIIIQCLFRNFKSRKIVNNKRKVFKATIIIQRICRGFVGK